MSNCELCWEQLPEYCRSGRVRVSQGGFVVMVKLHIGKQAMDAAHHRLSSGWLYERGRPVTLRTYPKHLITECLQAS